jgi:hypothetical protein
MLPGFRFLFAAIVSSMSILVFGLGAAALLRAAHEEVSSNPSWRAAPETRFAQQGETTPPVLALLRVEPQPAEPMAPENSPAAAAEPAAIASAPTEPAASASAPTEPAASASAPAEPAASAPTSAEPERIAALKPDDAPRPESAKPEMPRAESPAQAEIPPAQADAPAPDAETKIATSEQALSDKAPPDKAASEASPPANEAAPAVSEQISAPTSPDTDAGMAKIATLDDPAVVTETATPAKTARAKPDRSAIKKRQQARRAAQRRRMAALARVAQQPAQPVAANPFSQPTITLRKR